jgi:hypothetical protein
MAKITVFHFPLLADCRRRDVNPTTGTYNPPRYDETVKLFATSSAGILLEACTSTFFLSNHSIG